MRRRRGLLAALALLALTWAVYGQVRRFDFVNWDDHEYVSQNGLVRAGLSGEGFIGAFTTNVAGNWHPVTVLSHQIDIELYGTDPGGHHVTSVWIHAANGLLLFFLLWRMTGAFGASWFVAAVFLVHPLHVESAAWISERKDVLSTLFALLTIAAYLRYVRTPSGTRYGVVAGAYALALMSKPMVVTLPVLLLLLDWWPLGRAGGGRRAWWRLIAEKTPLLGLAVATGVVTLFTQSRVGAVAGLEAVTTAERVAGALESTLWYLWKTAWPTDLAAFYPRHPAPILAIWAAALTLAALTVFAIRERGRRPYLLAGWAWFLIGIAPVIGIVQVGEQARADRYTYLPLVGLAVAVAWAVRELPGRTLAARRGVAVAAAAAVLVLAAGARAQAACWSDSVTLWRRAVAVTSGNARAYENLGTALRERGAYEEALHAYAEAVRLAPRYAVVHNSMGLVWTKQGRTDEAIARYEDAVALAPNFVQARTNLANALAAAGRFEAALAQFAEVVRLDPASAAARVGLGATLLQMGRGHEAESPFTEAIRLDPALAEAHNGLGGALALQGRHAEAEACYREALRLKPGLVTALTNLALSQIALGRVEEARRNLEAALLVDPCYSSARDALLAIGARKGG
jgi:Flp pilus assembly protein TadD